jgi:WD40 repeat protein
MKKFILFTIILIFLYTHIFPEIKLIGEFVYNTFSVSSIAFSADGKFIISGGLDSRLNILDTKKFILLKAINNSEPVESVAVSSNSKFILSGGRDGGLRLWNAKTFELLNYSETGMNEIFALDFFNNSIFVAGGRNWLEIINIDNFKIIKKEFFNGFAVRDAKFTKNARYMAIAVGNKIRIYKLEQSNLVSKLFNKNALNFIFLQELEFPDLIYTIDISPNSQYLIAAGNSSYLSLIRIEDLAHLWSIKAHDSMIWDIKFSPDNKFIATAGKDATIKFIDTETGKILLIIAGHPDEIYSLDFSPDGNYLATACRDGKIRIWYISQNMNFKPDFLKINYLIIFIILFIILLMIKLLKKKKISVKNWHI